MKKVLFLAVCLLSVGGLQAFEAGLFNMDTSSVEPRFLTENEISLLQTIRSALETKIKEYQEQYDRAMNERNKHYQGTPERNRLHEEAMKFSEPIRKLEKELALIFNDIPRRIVSNRPTAMGGGGLGTMGTKVLANNSRPTIKGKDLSFLDSPYQLKIEDLARLGLVNANLPFDLSLPFDTIRSLDGLPEFLQKHPNIPSVDITKNPYIKLSFEELNALQLECGSVRLILTQNQISDLNPRVKIFEPLMYGRR